VQRGGRDLRAQGFEHRIAARDNFSGGRASTAGTSIAGRASTAGTSIAGRTLLCARGSLPGLRRLRLLCLRGSSALRWMPLALFGRRGWALALELPLAVPARAWTRLS
jgi:hypothetical protein